MNQSLSRLNLKREQARAVALTYVLLVSFIKPV